VQHYLANLPETYRLPLVLFYTENQSVHTIAETLDLSEDAVKQRLARGREMLRERMSGVLEAVLKRKRPTAIFTMAVAASIGALMAPSAIAAAAFTGSSVAAGASSASLGSQLLTAMSTSKAFLVTAALVALATVPIGYQVASVQTSSNKAAPASTNESSKPAALATNSLDFSDSALLAEWRHLHDVYGRTAQSMPSLFKAISDLKDPFRRQAFGAALVSEWVQVDPTNGFTFFLQKGRDKDQRKQFFEEWLKADPNAAVQALLAANSSWEMARDSLKEIAQRAPSLLAMVTEHLPKPEDWFDPSVRDAFAVLGSNGLDSARAIAESVSGPNRTQALAGVAMAWAKQDFAAAVAWAKGLPAGTDRDEVVRAALLGEAAVAPTSALESIEIVPAGGRPMTFADTTGAKVLAEAAKTDFDTTVAWLVAHPGRVGREELAGLGEAVTDRLNADVTGFLSAHAADGSLSVLMPALNHALLNAASGQQGAVWDWLKTQPDSDTLRPLKKMVLQFAGFQNPELALSILPDLPSTPAGDAQVKELARCLLNGGMALNRFDGLMQQAPDRLREPLLEAAFSSLRSDVSSIDPNVWVQRLPQLPEASRAQAAESLGRAWASQAPEDAIAWASAMAPGETKTDAEAAVVGTWAKTDPQAASEWVNSLPADTERDHSVESLVKTMSQSSPREAWDWALTIGDSGERIKAATQAAQMMAARDPFAARQLIDSGPFPPQTKLELQAALKQPVQ
jgi:hypothetical protein